jgi:hypothetical protein
MERSSQRSVQLFRRTRDFLVRAAPTAAYGDIGMHVESLGQTADRVAAAAIELDTRSRAARSGTQLLKRQMRALRLEYMRPIARTARARFANDAALRTALSMPRQVAQPEGLVAAAQAMANTAESNQAQFIAAGFPPDFVARLRGAAQVVLQLIDQRASDLARRSASAAAVQGEVAKGRAVMALLDAMLAPRLEGDAESSAEWRSLMRQGRLRRVVGVDEVGETGGTGGTGGTSGTSGAGGTGGTSGPGVATGGGASSGGSGSSAPSTPEVKAA